MKSVLMVLAEQARDGKCWPAQPTIADDCEISERAARAALAGLEAGGFIKREHRDGRPGRAQLIMLMMSIPEEVFPIEPAALAGLNRNGMPVEPERGAGKPIKNLYSPLTPQTVVSSGAAASSPAMVWIDVGSAQFEAWALRWDAERGRSAKPWTSQHPEDRSREGRWVASEWPEPIEDDDDHP